jgi:hypothetical protein
MLFTRQHVDSTVQRRHYKHVIESVLYTAIQHVDLSDRVVRSGETAKSSAVL